MADEKQIPEALWQLMQARLGYNDDEMKKFRENPRNQMIMRRSGDLLNKTVVFEVIESHSCNIEHKAGDKFYFSGEGYMLAHKGPKKVCPYILPAMARMMWVIQERIYEGLDPKPWFCHGHCDDVGIDCGGWGRVVFEAKVIDREK